MKTGSADSERRQEQPAEGDAGRYNSALSGRELQVQNAEYAGTAGVSRNNRGAGFVPAYRNTETGQTVISRFSDGRPSPVHVLDGLPEAWVSARDASGGVRKVSMHVIAGFVRDGVFYTREAAARVVAAERHAEN